MAPIARALGAACRRPRSIVLATAVAFCALAGVAQAYVIEGNRWPGTTITFYPSAYKKATTRAAQNWNNANVGVRLVRTSSKSHADLIVKYGAPQCEGVSLVGYQGPFQQSWTRLGRGCSRDFMVLTATHELGHILGLGHEERKCARMEPEVDLSGTPRNCHHH